MPTSIHRRVAAAREGSHPLVVGRMKSGWVFASEKQPVQGYCLLLPDPVVPTLNDLSGEGRSQFLADMGQLGDYLLSIVGAARINYEILGNLDPALHAHVVPRYLTEPDELKTKPIWFYDSNLAPTFDPESPWVLKLRQVLGGQPGC